MVHDPRFAGKEAETQGGDPIKLGQDWPAGWGCWLSVLSTELYPGSWVLKAVRSHTPVKGGAWILTLGI